MKAIGDIIFSAIFTGPFVVSKEMEETRDLRGSCLHPWVIGSVIVSRVKKKTKKRERHKSNKSRESLERYCKVSVFRMV